METSRTIAAERSSGSRTRVWLGVVLLAVGLMGHLLAAHAITPYVPAWVAYRDHVAGFLMLTVVSAVVVILLGWRFLRGRPDVTLLIVGALQTIIGLIFFDWRFRVVGLQCGWGRRRPVRRNRRQPAPVVVLPSFRDIRTIGALRLSEGESLRVTTGPRPDPSCARSGSPPGCCSRRRSSPRSP
jgi:hypothetical protein